MHALLSRMVHRGINSIDPNIAVGKFIIFIWLYCR